MKTNKQFFCIINILFLLLFVVIFNQANAVPMYYTFEGQVYALKDNAGIIADAGLDIDSEVTYNVLVDFETVGSWIDYDGIIRTFGSNSFYVDYISGSALMTTNSGPYEGSKIAEYNLGENYTPPNGTIPSTLLRCNSYYDIFAIGTGYIGKFFSELGVGDTLDVYNQAYGYNNASELCATVTITNISNVPPSPVPEPSTIFLFICGLFCLFSFSKKHTDI